MREVAKSYLSNRVASGQAPTLETLRAALEEPLADSGGPGGPGGPGGSPTSTLDESYPSGQGSFSTLIEMVSLYAVFFPVFGDTPDQSTGALVNTIVVVEEKNSCSPF